MANGKLQIADGTRTDRAARQNLIQNESFIFAVGIVRFCKMLRGLHEYDIASQLLRSGTSIGANIEEAQQAQSRPDFHAKMCIALKEAYESRYWLRLIAESIDASLKDIPLYLEQADRIIRLLVAITKKTRAT